LVEIGTQSVFLINHHKMGKSTNDIGSAAAYPG
jgi:hypothetical protein